VNFKKHHRISSENFLYFCKSIKVQPATTSVFIVQLRRLFQSFFYHPPERLSSLYPRVPWQQFEQMLCYKIKDKDLFVQALIHRSYIPVADIKLQSNERMEFLGDAVLNFIVGEYLFEQHPDKEEGELTVLRSQLVNRKALAFCAKEIKLKSFLISHTNSSGVIEKGFDTILSDAYEAIIAAIYKDGGLDAARVFVLTRMKSALSNGYLKGNDQNFKSELLELSQAKGKGVPRYQTVKEAGPDHDRTFTVEVLVGNEVMGSGIGKNKKEAEQAAAELAVLKLQETTTNS